MPKKYSPKKLYADRSTLYAKKSLGQHFLNDKKYLRSMADALGLPKDSPQPPEESPWDPGVTDDSRGVPLVVEIGPGKGSLTAELLARGARVIALEKDRRLIPFLQEKFAAEIASKQLRILEIDALEFDVGEISYQLAGNIPYYITGALIEKFLTIKMQPSRIVFLVQKEVAERIARSKKESLLSLSVKAYGTPRYMRTVPKGVFVPPPSVDSAILAIENISRNNFADSAHEKRFFELIHAGFAHKRKLLASNLKSFDFTKDSSVEITNTKESSWEAALMRCDIAPNARAEDVALEQWLLLARKSIL